MTILTRMDRFLILLIVVLFTSGCLSDADNNNNFNHSISECSATSTKSLDPPSPLLNGESTATQFSLIIDNNNRIVNDYAQSHISESGRGNYSIKQVLDIWDYTVDQWCYEGHPDDYAYYKSASNLIKGKIKDKFHGNCVNFATVISASTESLGGRSRIIKVGGQNMDWHVYPEIFIGSSENEIQPTLDYIKKRYSTQNVYYHKEIDSNGSTEYWLNLDYIPQKPGGARYDDVGFYYVYYPEGEYHLSRDSGYPENSPKFPIDIDTNATISLKIPYHSGQNLLFHSSGTEINMINVTSDYEVTAFIFNQKDLDTFAEFLKQNSSQLTWRACYTNIKSRNFNFTPSIEGDYYLAIANYPALLESADSQRDVNITVSVIQNPLTR